MQASSVETEGAHSVTTSAEEDAILAHANHIRPREEMTALLIGFGTGLTIALVFLVYVLFDIAGWLP